ncbi:hypothetical protein AB4Y35_08625 [Paraburkholderia sp. EG286A]|uniref:hypothetical protein n=1 Tax=Paraburkholderia sp. EG286A TaxID=3237014 RepID=UPI0034D17B7C
MKSALIEPIIAVASGCIWLMVAPDAGAAVFAATSISTLGMRLMDQLRGDKRRGIQAVRRIESAVRADLEKWATSENVPCLPDLDIVERLLLQELPSLLVNRSALAAASIHPDGFIQSCSGLLLNQLSERHAIFSDATDGVARKLVSNVLVAALKATLEEKGVFEKFQPYFAVALNQSIGILNREVGAIDNKLDEVLARIEASGINGGLSRPEVRALLTAFFEEQVPEADAQQLLLQKADELRDLKRKFSAALDADQDLKEALDGAFKALNDGRYDDVAQRIETMIEDGGAKAARSLAVTFSLYELRADLAYVQARYVLAAKFYGVAAGVGLAYNKHATWVMLEKQAQSLLDHGRMVPGTRSLQSAIDVCRRRLELAPPQTPMYVESATQLINALGIYSERCEHGEASLVLETAIGLGRPIFQNVNSELHPEIWVGMANGLGATLNNAARLAVGEQRDAFLEEAVAVLKAGDEMASRHGSGYSQNIKTNLATAIRLQSRDADERRDSLGKAIEYRLQVVKDLDDNVNPIEAGNALDSLGNDYAALAMSGNELDRQAFVRALVAYRKALAKRPRTTFLVNWARTQYNIGSLYLAAAGLESDGLRRRRIWSASNRLEAAVAELSKEETPQDWLVVSQAHARSMLWLLQDGEEMPSARLAELAGALEEASAFADHMGNIDFVISLLEMQMALASLTYARRMPGAIEVIERQSQAIEKRRSFYRNTPLTELIDIVYAQLDVMLGHLNGDNARAKRGLKLAIECKQRTETKGPQWLTTEIESILQDLCGVVAEMEQNAASA